MPAGGGKRGRPPKEGEPDGAPGSKRQRKKAPSGKPTTGPIVLELEAPGEGAGPGPSALAMGEGATTANPFSHRRLKSNAVVKQTGFTPLFDTTGSLPAPPPPPPPPPPPLPSQPTLNASFGLGEEEKIEKIEKTEKMETETDHTHCVPLSDYQALELKCRDLEKETIVLREKAVSCSRLARPPAGLWRASAQCFDGNGEGVSSAAQHPPILLIPDLVELVQESVAEHGTTEGVLPSLHAAASSALWDLIAACNLRAIQLDGDKVKQGGGYSAHLSYNNSTVHIVAGSVSQISQNIEANVSTAQKGAERSEGYTEVDGENADGASLLLPVQISCDLLAEKEEGVGHMQEVAVALPDTNGGGGGRGGEGMQGKEGGGVPYEGVGRGVAISESYDSGSVLKVLQDVPTLLHDTTPGKANCIPPPSGDDLGAPHATPTPRDAASLPCGGVPPPPTVSLRKEERGLDRVSEGVGCLGGVEVMEEDEVPVGGSPDLFAESVQHSGGSVQVPPSPSEVVEDLGVLPLAQCPVASTPVGGNVVPESPFAIVPLDSLSCRGLLPRGGEGEEGEEEDDEDESEVFCNTLVLSL